MKHISRMALDVFATLETLAAESISRGMLMLVQSITNNRAWMPPCDPCALFVAQSGALELPRR
jgi:hypothetical protein